MTLTFDLTHDLDLGCFKVKFQNSSISRIVGLIDVKWKGSELIWYWANCMTLPFDHTHDLDLGVSRSESEIALSQEWGSRLTMNEKDVSHPFMTMILTCVTVVAWADVPDSDRGDFRRRRAVDISSCICYGQLTYKKVWYMKTIHIVIHFYPSARIGLEGYCRHLPGGRALPHTVTALPGAVLTGSQPNLVGTNLGAGSRTSSFMGDMAH